MEGESGKANPCSVLRLLRLPSTPLQALTGFRFRHSQTAKFGGCSPPPTWGIVTHGHRVRITKCYLSMVPKGGGRGGGSVSKVTVRAGLQLMSRPCGGVPAGLRARGGAAGA